MLLMIHCTIFNVSFSGCMYQSEVKIQFEIFGWAVRRVSS